MPDIVTIVEPVNAPVAVTVGEQGPPGAGGIPGGTSGDWLVKVGATDFSTGWLARTAANVPYVPAGTIAANNVQGAIQEIEVEYLAAIAGAGVGLATEQAARIAADTVLTNSLNAETARATAAEGVNAANIVIEIGRATAAETTIAANLATETSSRIAGDAATLASARAYTDVLDAAIDQANIAYINVGNVFSVDQRINAKLGIGIAPTAQLHTIVSGAGIVGQVIKMAVGQTANVWEIQGSDGVARTKVDSNSYLTTQAVTAYYGITSTYGNLSAHGGEATAVSAGTVGPASQSAISFQGGEFSLYRASAMLLQTPAAVKSAGHRLINASDAYYDAFSAGYFGFTNGGSPHTVVAPHAAADVGLMVQLPAGSTGNPIEVRDSTNALKLWFTASGMYTVGTGNHQFWKDAGPSKAWAYGMAVPGGSVQNDLVFSSYGGSWIERARLTDTYLQVISNIQSDSSHDFGINAGATTSDVVIGASSRTTYFKSAALGNTIHVSKGFAGQTGDQYQARDSADVVMSRIKSNGTLAIGTDPTGALLTVNGDIINSVSARLSILRGINGQTGNMQEWQRYNGGLHTWIDANGVIGHQVAQSGYGGLQILNSGTTFVSPTSYSAYIEAPSVGGIPLVLRSIVSQTGDFWQAQDSSGSVKSQAKVNGDVLATRLLSTGGFFADSWQSYGGSSLDINATNINARLLLGSSGKLLAVNNLNNALMTLSPTSPHVKLQALAADQVPLEIKGYTSQSQPLTLYRDSADVIIQTTDYRGWLGIGTAPSDMIHVSGAAPAIRINNTNANGGAWYIQSTVVGTDSALNFARSGTADWLLQLNAGNSGTGNRGAGIGIAGNAPLARLHVKTEVTSQVVSMFQGMAGQTGDLIKAPNSAGTDMFRVAINGYTYQTRVNADAISDQGGLIGFYAGGVRRFYLHAVDGLVIDDTQTIAFAGATGVKVGRAADKFAFWGKAPIVQPAALGADAVDLPTALVLLNNIKNNVLTPVGLAA